LRIEIFDQGTRQGAAREMVLAEGFPQWGLVHGRTVSEASRSVPIWLAGTPERTGSMGPKRRKSLVFLEKSPGAAHGTPLAAWALIQE
jgi:hypothetical protein